MNIRARNPYIAGNPLTGREGFFGRKDLLDWVSTELLNTNTNALVLYGQRRVGKTTLLLQLQKYLPRDRFFPVYFDLQDQSQKRLGKVLADLVDAAGSGINLREYDTKDFDDEGKYFRSVFLSDLYHALSENVRPVFLLDEFDVLDQEGERSLPGQAASHALFPFLRQLMNSEGRPAFVFIVGRRSDDLRVNFAQIFKNALAKEVWVLDRPSAEALVRQAEINKTLKFAPESVERILQITNCHPYFTQLVCQRIWEHIYIDKPTEIPLITVDDVISSIPETLEVSHHAFTWLWDGLSPAEKIYAAALAEVSNEGVSVSEDRVVSLLVEKGSRLLRRDAELAPRDLVNRRVLILTENREYLFAVELFRRWAKKNRPLSVVVNEIDRVDSLADQLYQIGANFFNRRDWDEAVRFYKESLKHNPNHFQANLFLGETYLSLGRIEDAVSQLETAYILDTNEAKYPFVRALMSLAKEKEKAGLYQEALVACERALEISPNEQLAQDIRKTVLEKLSNAKK